MEQKRRSFPTFASTPEGILHLSKQQLFYLFVGTLFIGGLLFSLGVMTGKRMVALAENTKEDLEKMEVAADIQRKVKNATPDEKGELTAETAEGQQPQTPPEAKEKAAEPVRAEPAKTEIAKANTNTNTVPTPPQQAQAGAPGQSPEQKTAEQNKPPEKPAEAPKAQQVQAPKEPQPQPAENKAAEEAKRTPPKEVSAKILAQPSKEYDPNGTWTLQVGSLSDDSQADKIAKPLKTKGYMVDIKETDVVGKGKFWRVRVGRFTTKEDASTFQKKYEADNKPQTPTMITRF